MHAKSVALRCSPPHPLSCARSAPTLTRIAAESPTCVFGGRDVIAKSNAGFNVVDLMG